MSTTKRYRNTAYDDAFRTVEQECPEALIYFVNEMFGENYGNTAIIEHLRNEHYVQNKGEATEKRICDSHIRITTDSKISNYHLECESSGYSDSILVRIFQYAIDHAIKDSEEVHNKLTVRIPASGLLILRNKGNPPKHMTFEITTPNGSISYDAPVICMKGYSLDDIFAKRMYFILPFYFFNFEDRFILYNKDAESLKEFEEIYCEVIERLQNVDEVNLSLRSKGVIIKQMENVVKRLAYRRKRITEKVGDIMGGKVLKMEWLEKFDAAVAEGKAEGGDIRDAERISDMLRRGKTVDEIVDFCGYPVELVKKVEESMLAATN